MAAGIGQFGAIQSVATSFGMELSAVDLRDRGRDRACRRGLCALGEWWPDRDGGPVDYSSSYLITTLATRHKLPAIYPDRYFVAVDGLISYGPDLVDQSVAPRLLRRSHLKGREAGRPTGTSADQI